MKKAVWIMAVSLVVISITAYSFGVVSSNTESAAAAGVETSISTSVNVETGTTTAPVTSEKAFSSMIDGEISTQLAMNERK